MCPICIAAIAVTVVKVGSAGGITALVAPKLRSRIRGGGSVDGGPFEGLGRKAPDHPRQEIDPAAGRTSAR